MLTKRTGDLQRLSQHTLQELEALTAGEWHEPVREKRDWKKVILIIGLGALSWVATFIGMLELIQANMGELPLATKAVVGFSVAMLMVMIIWLLDQLFAPHPMSTKVAYVIGYIFLTTISVGFGFGFYWKVLESRSEASRSAESAVTQVQGSLVAASSRLDQLQMTLTDLTKLSRRKAEEEREFGTSCPNSSPGDGPRRRLRDADAARFDFASSFVKGRADQVKVDLAALDADLAKIASGDPSTIDPKTNTRNGFMRNLERKLELTSTRFNAFRGDPQLAQIRNELDQRSTKTIFPTGRGNGTFSCPDPQLQTALRGVVRAIDQLPILAKPSIATVEGAEAVIEAFRRLSATFYGALSFELPPSADEMRALQKQAVRQAEDSGRQPIVTAGIQGGLTKRDYIPLAIALFVDLCLLLVSIGRPMNRLDGLVPKMRSAERGPVYQILSKFSDIHKDPEVRDKFEMFRHVVFDFNGDYYVAVPLDAPRNRNPDEVRELQQEAHLLANLFASFEKEKIFSRVINPLLSTKTIRKKLWRQGSKFAGSDAFRVYRFRDGAWSEIILGAVMGAAKRAQLERRRKILASGPRLPGYEDDPDAQTQPPTEQTAATVPPAAGEAADTDAAPNDAVAPSAEAVASGRRRAAVAVAALDPALSRAFGPHAASAARDLIFDDDLNTADEAPAARGTTRDPLPTRIRRLRQKRSADRSAEPSFLKSHKKKRPAPVEAEIELRQRAEAAQQSGSTAEPVGSQASDDLPPDNVVDIAARLRRFHAHEAAVANPTPPAADAPASEAPFTPTPASHDAHNAGAKDARHVHVRLTERTADFQVPVTDASLPFLNRLRDSGATITADQSGDHRGTSDGMIAGGDSTDQAGAWHITAATDPGGTPHTRRIDGGDDHEVAALLPAPEETRMSSDVVVIEELADAIDAFDAPHGTDPSDIGHANDTDEDDVGFALDVTEEPDPVLSRFAPRERDPDDA